jgi:hypothetical protein
MMKNFITNFAFHQLKKNNLFKRSRMYFSIFVKTQSTPNPHFLKFSPGKEILKDGETYDFSDMKQASISPLARKIFEVIFYLN